jgi:S1-C subfamily serine protease
MTTPRAIGLGLLVAATLLPRAPAGARAASIQEILLRAKPGVVLVVAEVGGEVTLDCGGSTLTVTPAPARETGSGWLVDGAGWVVTNAHVVRSTQVPDTAARTELVDRAVHDGCVPRLLARRGLAPDERPDVETELTNRVLAAAASGARVRATRAIHVMLPSGRRLPATMVEYGAPADDGMSGEDLALLHVEARDLPALPLGDSSMLQIGDPLWVIGFPQAVLSHELLDASAAAMEASITRGAVSGFKQDRAGQSVIQTDASTAAGTSGGPVIDAGGRVVGVVTFVTMSPGDGGSVQGFNFVIPAQAVRRFLGGTPAALGGTSRFDAAWYGALAAFFDGDHATAARRLATAERLVPGLPDVARLSAENAERLAHTPARGPWRRLGAAAVAIGLCGYAGLAVVRRRRNRFRINPADVARLLETPRPPIVLDVREESAYARSPVRLPGAVRLTSADLDARGAAAIEADRTVVAYCT